METSYFLQSGLWWVLALVVGFSLAMLVLGEVILRLGHYLTMDPFWSLRLKHPPRKAFDTKYLYL